MVKKTGWRCNCPRGIKRDVSGAKRTTVFQGFINWIRKAGK